MGLRRLASLVRTRLNKQVSCFYEGEPPSSGRRLQEATILDISLTATRKRMGGSWTRLRVLWFLSIPRIRLIHWLWTRGQFIYEYRFTLGFLQIFINRCSLLCVFYERNIYSMRSCMFFEIKLGVRMLRTKTMLRNPVRKLIILSRIVNKCNMLNERCARTFAHYYVAYIHLFALQPRTFYVSPVQTARMVSHTHYKQPTMMRSDGGFLRSNL